nr:DNA polymerase III subunit beta [Prevotella sp.]
MRFVLSSSALSSRLNMLAKVISSKNSLPILDCFLFQVANNVMTITASDSDNVIKSVIDLTECEGEGEFCIPNKVILDALKELPEQPLTLDVTPDSYAVKIVYQNGLYNFTAQSAEDYPHTQSMTDAANSIMIPATVLIDNISRSLFATANDELRPIMNGVYFDLTPDALAIVASDGHKLVRNKNFSITSETPASFNLPKKPANLLKNILTKDGGDVLIKFDDRNAEIKYNDGVLNCRLIDGRYPNYNSVIPTDNPSQTTVDRRALLSALRRVLPFASESSQLVRLHMENGRFEVSSEDIDFATSAKEQLSCEYTGAPMSIGFKGSSLMEVLSNLNSDQVVIMLADPSRAGIIVPAEQPEDEDVLMLIMPMLLND